MATSRTCVVLTREHRTPAVGRPLHVILENRPERGFPQRPHALLGEPARHTKNLTRPVQRTSPLSSVSLCLCGRYRFLRPLCALSSVPSVPSRPSTFRP